MSEVQVLQPQKTWSHLVARRRKPSEYEIVSANLHYNDRDANAPYELDPNMFMNEWYKKNTFGTALKHDDWNSFRDPDEVIYRTYNLMQDGQETYVFGLFDQFSEREHDKALDKTWVGSLARRYSPLRYLYHTLQMSSAYVGQVSPASTITNCNYFQMADSLRWVSHTAYRMGFTIRIAFNPANFIQIITTAIGITFAFVAAAGCVFPFSFGRQAVMPVA